MRRISTGLMAMALMAGTHSQAENYFKTDSGYIPLTSYRWVILQVR